MFVSHEKSNGKKIYQKPNILRKPKPKVSSLKLCVSEGHESLDHEFTVHFEAEEPNKARNNQKIGIQKTKIVPSVKTPVKLKDKHIVRHTQEKSKKPDQNPINERIEELNSTDDFLEQSSINIDSFLNEDVSDQNILFDMDISSGKQIDYNSQSKWCLNLMDENPKLVLEDYNGSNIADVCIDPNKQLETNMVPLSKVSALKNEKNSFIQENELIFKSTVPTQNYTIDQFSQKRAKFVCDKPNCDKKFMSEQKLKKHLEIHNKEANGRLPRQATIECPIKKNSGDGIEQSCGKIFLVKEDLVKHLNDDHQPEEAPYQCAECSRRFFFAAGLRAHGRAHTAAAPAPCLRCAWAGCGREFRLPCRLREHTRKHTGDKPYHCPYPSCEWSFRTASKLLRHARRHTGERRHACGACGRAFLRREHLRDHIARHRTMPAGCTQSIATAKLLGVHVKRAQKTADKKSATTIKPEVPLLQLESEPSNNSIMVNMKEEEESMRMEAGPAGSPSPPVEASVSARTHCTWPLQRNYSVADTVLVLEHDYQNEPSESSESHIFTVRSDLFLHGNILNNEDSEQMASVIEGDTSESRGGGVTGDVTGDVTSGVTGDVTDGMDVTGTGLVDLGLLDTHSTIDLMQFMFYKELSEIAVTVQAVRQRSVHRDASKRNASRLNSVAAFHSVMFKKVSNLYIMT